MADYASAARKIIPNMPAGGGGALFAVVGLAAGGYGLYNSVVTGTLLHPNSILECMLPSDLKLNLTLTNSTLATVQPGHLGVVYNRIGGLDDKSNLREGLNLLVPWFQRPVIFDIRTRPQVNNSNAVHIWVANLCTFVFANNNSTKSYS